MVSVVGKQLRLLSCCLMVVPVYAAMHIEFLDSDGSPLQCAGVGQPFIVSVVVDANNMNTNPEVEGISEYYSGWAEMKMSVCNGKGVCRYNYGVRVDEPGTYTFGPARMHVGDHEESGDAAQIEVRQEACSTDTKKSKRAEPFARMTVSKSVAFVREPIECSVRFYSLHGDEARIHIQQPPSDDLVILNSEGEQRKGVETIEGQQWHYSEITWRMYAKKAGSLVIPACVFEYATVEHHGFWLPEMKQKRLCSNAVTLTVEALPDCGLPIKAVGSFTRFDAQVEPAVARAGDAIVLTLRLEGEGLLDETSPVHLEGMPPALKWYESKQYDLDPQRDGAKGKAFEFVVQGVQEGSWEIPAQMFTFFLTDMRQCHTLQTTPLTVTITPGVVPTSVASEPHKPSVTKVIDDGLCPLIDGDGYSFFARVHYYVPWWLMLVLIAVPGIGVFFARARRSWQKMPTMRRKTFFSRAHKDLADLMQADDVQGLYALFSRLLGRLYDDPSLDLMSEKVTIRLRDAGIGPETLERWQQFVERCAECSFYTPSPEAVSKESLFLVARQWLEYLKERL